MKRLILVVLALFVLTLASCGCEPVEPPMEPPVEPPTEPPTDPSPPIVNSVDFSCVSVDNDEVCSGQESDGIWNSGSIAISGQPMPNDYLNIEVTNTMIMNASIFVYSPMTIDGCWPEPVAFPVATLEGGQTAMFSRQTNNYRCGALGHQEAVVGIYNASGFDPSDYLDPLYYPRTDLIKNTVVIWNNALPGDL